MDILTILGKIGFDWQVALANLVNFLIIFWILKRFAFAPIKKAILTRQERIREGLSRADEADQELDRAQGQAEGIIDEARKEADVIVSEARRRHDRIIDDAERTATNKAEGIIMDGRSVLDHERKQMEHELRSKTALLVTASVQKILDEDIDEKRASMITASLVE